MDEASGFIDEAERLIKQLKDPDTTRVKMIEAIIRLGGLRDNRAVPALIEALKDDDFLVRWEAAEALGKIKDPSAVPALIAALGNEDRGTRSGAARALSKIGDAAVPALIEALKDASAGVRGEAALELGRIGAVKAIGPLIDALKDEYRSVMESAAHALSKIARKADINLVKIQASLGEFVDRKKEPDRRERSKQWAAEAYAKIAKAVSERKLKDIPKDGVLLEKETVKPPKEGLYRAAGRQRMAV